MTKSCRSSRAPLVWLAIGTLLAGCSDLRGNRIDPPLASWAYEPEIRIGAVDDPEYAFTSVSALRVGPDGSIYTLHEQEVTIRRWTPDGLPAGSFGRHGSGPGEFQRPITMGMRGDTLWVMDLDGYRFTLFALDGTPVGTLAPRVDIGGRDPEGREYFPARPTGLLADGTVLGSTPAFSSAISEGTLTSIAFVRMSPEGAEQDTIAVVPVSRFDNLGIAYGQGHLSTFQPFGDRRITTTTFDDDGLLILDRTAATNPVGAEFRLTRLGLAGDTVFSRAYPYEPIELPRTEVDSAIAATAERLHEWVGERTGTRLGQWQSWVREAMYAPAYRTPIGNLVPGRDGTIWLALHDPQTAEREWLVLADDGEPLAKVRLPKELRVLLADRTAVWGVEKDDLDVEYIVRYAASGT